VVGELEQAVHPVDPELADRAQVLHEVAAQIPNLVTQVLDIENLSDQMAE